jgi:multidrug efflux pump subunit AcrB
MVVTRNYGKTADAKVNNLLSSLLFAIITVVALIAVTMGWKEGMVVGLSVPVSFSLALFELRLRTEVALFLGQFWHSRT